MSVIVFGEGMLEISGFPEEGARLGYGGDTLNTAIYLARAGVEVEFVSSLGDDPFSAWMKRAWRDAGLKLDHCLTLSGGKPGLYAISVDARGERSFTYWRRESAATRFFDHASADAAIVVMKRARRFFCSGITLSIFNERDRSRVYEVMEAVRANGGDVVFDVNYRPRGWAEPALARRAVDEALQQATIAFVSAEDWALLHGAADPAKIADAWLARGVREFIVKDGARGCYFASSDGRGWIAPEAEVEPIDTTGAGDSFNAAYLAARIRGATIPEACLEGNRLAAAVIGHRGAIMPA